MGKAMGNGEHGELGFRLFLGNGRAVIYHRDNQPGTEVTAIFDLVRIWPSLPLRPYGVGQYLSQWL